MGRERLIHHILLRVPVLADGMFGLTELYSSPLTF